MLQTFLKKRRSSTFPTMKAYIRTYGCQMNERDSENIAAGFLSRGCSICDSDADADIVVVNTCSVRAQAEQKALGKLGHVIKRRNARRSNLPVVCVAGCMAQNMGESLLDRLPDLDLILGTRQIHRVAELCVEFCKRRMAGLEPREWRAKTAPRKEPRAAHGECKATFGEFGAAGPARENGAMQSLQDAQGAHGTRGAHGVYGVYGAQGDAAGAPRVSGILGGAADASAGGTLGGLADSVSSGLPGGALGKAAFGAFVDISDDAQSHRLIDMHLPSASRPCAFVSIMQGCQMSCSYCIVPKTRGVQRSRPEGEILAEIERLADGGTREVTLLGQVVNAYGREGGGAEGAGAFVRLLKKIAAIGGIERIRFTSPHPSFFGGELIDCYSSLKELCPYVHLPMQSGSDRILRQMRRPYDSARFLGIVEKLRAARADISISTDVIVGFPGESEDDFNMTRRLFAECGFDMAYIFKYSPRDGTPSAECDDGVPEGVKEERNQILLSLLQSQSQAFNDALVGSVQTVLVESAAKRGDGVYMGRTPHHRKVFFKGGADLPGKFVNVKILGASVSALSGEIA